MKKFAVGIVQGLLFLLLLGWTFYLIESPLYFDFPRIRFAGPILAAVFAFVFGRITKPARVFWIITGILSLWITVAIRPFADVKREGAMAGNLSLMRIELDNFKKKEGRYPSTLSELHLWPNALTLRLYPHHPKTERILTIDNSTSQTIPTDSGMWVYEPTSGKLIINCTHEKQHGGSRPWSEL